MKGRIYELKLNPGDVFVLCRTGARMTFVRKEGVHAVVEYLDPNRRAKEKALRKKYPKHETSFHQSCLIEIVKRAKVDPVKEPELTDEQAQEMLDRLSKHFKEPVMPMSKYCKALSTWARIVENKFFKENEDKSYHEQRNYPYAHLTRIMVNIRKSNLLYRLLYKGEELRKESCPEHKGKWGMSHVHCACGGTGWLPNPGDEGEYVQGVYLVKIPVREESDT